MATMGQTTSKMKATQKTLKTKATAKTLKTKKTAVEEVGQLAEDAK